MKAVMLTVQKRNISAMNFYTRKLRYTISSISPSRVDPLIGAKKSYEILCETFDSEAKTKLEEDGRWERIDIQEHALFLQLLIISPMQSLRR